MRTTIRALALAAMFGAASVQADDDWKALLKEIKAFADVLAEGQPPQSGTAAYTFDDGSHYEGDWRVGKPHGKGEMLWADGTAFKGIWASGQPVNGTMTFTDGEKVPVVGGRLAD